MLELHHVVALGIFSTYFIVILSLFSLILADLWSLRVSKRCSTLGAVVFIGLTTASLTHTWFYMIKYMTWSFTKYELGLSNPGAQGLLHRFASWLHETSLFEEAWTHVCVHPVNWWWSEQLCLFTAGVWTVLIAVEGRRHNIKHLWAYMLLGQVVAISVASNLFYLALLLSQPSVSSRRHMTVSPRLVISVLLSLATVALSPFTSPKTFLPNLLVMHVLLFIPLISNSPSSPQTPSPTPFFINLKTLYRIIHLACAGIHIRTILAATGSLQASVSGSSSSNIFNEVWRILYSHPAQSSIGWDVIWTSLSFIVWILLRPTGNHANKYGIMAFLILSTPVSSIAVAAPYALQPKGEAVEGIRADNEEKKK